MPAKHDWSWVSEVDNASEITDDHRLRVAGLKRLNKCPFAFSLDPDVIPVKDRGCTERRCTGNPACLNYLGVETLLDEKGKKKFVDDKLVTMTAREDSPAGLKNLGATCYANAFLQLWFYNVAFRNAIYSSSPVEGSPLFHLAYIFASLQYTQRSYVDPTSLIEALRLDKGDQQDAGEFCKLFLDLISAELMKRGVSKGKSVTDELFAGTKEITITCSECRYESPRQELFLELEIPLKDGESLLDRLRHTLGDELLSGSNQYNCPRCQSKQDAVRHTSLRDLPTILQFTLVRFAYDLKAGQKKKSKATIKFPQELSVGNHRYHLQAVVSHFGSDNHGHFVCEALDSSSGCWWLCNDEEVTQIDREVRMDGKEIGVTEPPTKRLKAGSSEDLRSRDAYMLVYSRQDTQDRMEPPQEVMRKVEQDDGNWMKELGDQEIKKYILEEEYDSTTQAKKQVAAVLQGSEQLLPSKELQRWFDSSSVADMFRPWTIPTCGHGAIDPMGVQDFKLVSQAAFDLLRDYCSPNTPSVTGHQSGSKVEAAIATGDGIRHADGSSMETRKIRGQSPSASTSTSYPSLPELPICAECVAETYSEKAVPQIVLTQAERNAWTIGIKADKNLMKNEMNKEPQVYGIDYNYLPTSFVLAWIDYVMRPMMPEPRLEPNLGRCEHGLLDVDLEMDGTHYISAQGWDMLMNAYGPATPITFQFKIAPEPGKRHNKSNPSVGLCEPCRTKRLSDFTETKILIELQRTVSAKDAPARITLGRSSRRAKPKQMTMNVTKSTKLLDVKVMVYNESGILPNFLGLFHNGREIDKDETIESASILSGDTIVCREIDRIDMSDDDPAVEQERGFGGTALTGRIRCPDCTFENDSGALGCEMCQRPFGFD